MRRLPPLRFGWRGLSLVALTVFSVAVAALWPRSDTSHLPDTTLVSFPTSPPQGPVEIVGVKAAAVWTDASRPEVSVSVRNNGDVSIRAKVWWLLSARGDTAPWKDPSGTGRPQEVELRAGATKTLQVQATAPAPAGVWTLTLWAHVVQGDTETHSHGGSVTPFISVVSADSGLVQLSGPGGRAVIRSLRPSSRLAARDETATGQAEVSVSATTQQPINVLIQCFLTPGPVARPWLEDRAVASQMQQLLLDGPVPRTGICAFDHLPASGQWSLSAVAWRPAGPLPQPPEDAVQLAAPILLGTSSP